MKLAWVAVGMISIVWTTAVSAAVPPPQLGDKVRVDFTKEVKGETAPILRMQQMTGLLAYADTSTWRIESRRRIRVDEPALVTSLAVTDFERVRIRDGRSSSKGAWIGAALGLFAGATAAVLAGADEEGGIFERGGLQFGLLLPIGTAAGAVTGSRIGVDRWREFPVSDVFHMETVGAQP
jgi:hypothetical protein